MNTHTEKSSTLKEIDSRTPSNEFFPVPVHYKKYECEGVDPFEVVVCNYSNKLLILVTQMNKLGSMVRRSFFFKSFYALPSNKSHQTGPLIIKIVFPLRNDYLTSHAKVHHAPTRRPTDIII